MPGRSLGSVVVADTESAEFFAIELIRNKLIARFGANVLASGIEAWPKLRDFLNDEVPRYGGRCDPSIASCDVYVIGRAFELPTCDAVETAIVMPGVHLPIVARYVVAVTVGTPCGEVVVVPGTAQSVGGVHVLTAEAFGRLRRAEQIVRERTIRALVLSGWGGRQDGPAEAIQMLAAWRGPQVPVILDEAARTTAENALWAARLAHALGDVQRVRVVASWISAPRLGLAMYIALRRVPIRLGLSIVWGRRHMDSWRPALGGLVHLRRHLRAGRALIAHGPDSPEAQL